MGMDLCYYGIKEEEIPKILDGNFEEDFSELEPSYTTRVFSAKDFYYLYTGGKELEEEDFQGKNERDIFTEALLGEVTVSFAPEDIYSYCSCKEKIKEISNFLNKIDIKDYFEKIGIIEEISGKNFKGENFSYLGVKTTRKFYSSMEEEEYIFDIKATTNEFNELKEFYNKLANENLALYIYIF
ncbi:DUF1877 domain-containing protein [Fusobacterium polymorphum]|mgnify:FL=1|uniref:DUF1877 domain-containing protein n=1 Tax=Fusobacterium nucleatum subsp. polymorphum TaxID=76857 RepID=A0A2C6AAQ3_FUSNP|nr:DUF1877 domain-containing protein [Fusobacterium polymorphum]PHH99158.1 DUF1877 domain-containing protein [Fusobacterium polymorphum]PIM76013.1 DUF1877 domain-containing protein [Fusobacterium polymorphum]